TVSNAAAGRQARPALQGSDGAGAAGTVLGLDGGASRARRCGEDLPIAFFAGKRFLVSHFL
ncbi:MAG: hypothetical protein ORN49_13515, partial [Rhodobacteraceae bacterium]|nr:hypothetical protein [Paracoccaceae bacterium]